MGSGLTQDATSKQRHAGRGTTVPVRLWGTGKRARSADVLGVRDMAGRWSPCYQVQASRFQPSLEPESGTWRLRFVALCFSNFGACFFSSSLKG